MAVPIGKEVIRIDKNGEEITKNISYILQIIDSAKFMASSLSNLVNNISEKFIELNVNLDLMLKNAIATVYLNTQILENI